MDVSSVRLIFDIGNIQFYCSMQPHEHCYTLENVKNESVG